MPRTPLRRCHNTVSRVRGASVAMPTSGHALCLIVCSAVAPFALSAGTFHDDVPMAMALGALLQLMVVSNPNNSTRIISKAACALANLSAVKPVCERLLQSPEGVTACLQLLRMTTPAVTLHAVRVLNNIADLPDAPATIVDAGGMRTLLSVINSRDQHVQRTALRVAVKLSASVLQPTRVGDSTTLFRVLQLFENARNPEIRVGLLDLLVQLSNNSDLRARLVAAGILKTLAKLLLPATSPAVLCQVCMCRGATLTQSPTLPLSFTYHAGVDSGPDLLAAAVA